MDRIKQREKNEKFSSKKLFRVKCRTFASGANLRSMRLIRIGTCRSNLQEAACCRPNVPTCKADVWCGVTRSPRVGSNCTCYWGHRRNHSSKSSDRHLWSILVPQVSKDIPVPIIRIYYGYQIAIKPFQRIFKRLAENRGLDNHKPAYIPWNPRESGSE